MAASSTPAGWPGWSAQSVPVLAAPAGWPGWSAQGVPALAAPAGWPGWSAQGVPTLAAPAGWPGWAAGQPLNLRLTVRLPATQAPADTYVPLTLALTYAPLDATLGPPEHLALPYAAGGQYGLSAPPGVQLTLAVESARYEAASQVATLAAGQLTELVVQLAFRAGARPQATKVRRRPAGPPAGAATLYL